MQKLKSEPNDSSIATHANNVILISLISLALQGVQIVLGIVSVPLMLKEIGKTQYAILAILWVFPSFLPLIDLGLPRALASALVRKQKPERAESLHYLFAALALQCVVLGFLCLVWLFFDGWLGISNQLLNGNQDSGNPTSIVRTFLTASAILSLTNLIAAYFQGEGRLWSLLAVTGSASFLVSLVPFLSCSIDPQLETFAWITLTVRCVIALGAMALVSVAWRSIAKSSELSYSHLLDKMWQCCKQLVTSGTQSIAYFALSPLLIFGERYLASYFVTKQVMSNHLIAVDLGLRCLVVPGVVGQFSFRSISDSAGKRSFFDIPLRTYLAFMVWIYLLPVLIGVLFATELLAFWLGERNTNYTVVICSRIAIASIASIGVSNFLVQTSLITDSMRKLSASVIVQLPVYFGCVFLILWSKPAAWDSSIILTCLWSLRTVGEAIVMLVLSKDHFSRNSLQNLVVPFIIIPVLVAIFANYAEVAIVEWRITLKSLAVVIIVFGLWRQFGLPKASRSGRIESSVVRS